MDKKWCMVFLLYVYQLSDFVSCSEVEGRNLTKEKSGNICNLELTREIEKVLNDSLEEIHKLDVVKLKSELYISPEIRMRHGIMRGLSTFTNITEMKAFCTEDGKIIFNTTVRLNDAEIAYSRKRNGFFPSIKYHTSMKASILDCTLEIFFDLNRGIGFKVNKCKLSEGADFKIGLSSLGRLVGYSMNYFRIFRKKTESVLEWIMRDLMEDKLLQAVQANDGLSWSYS